MNHYEKKREFVEPELLKCDEPLDVITMGGYHGSGEPPKRYKKDWKHGKHFPFFHKWWR